MTDEPPTLWTTTRVGVELGVGPHAVYMAVRRAAEPGKMPYPTPDAYIERSVNEKPVPVWHKDRMPELRAWWNKRRVPEWDGVIRE